MGFLIVNIDNICVSFFKLKGFLFINSEKWVEYEIIY